MAQFVFQSRLPVPPADAFAFHQRPDIFSLLLPPWQKVKVISRHGGLRVGARVEFRIYFGPFYKTWVAVHTEYEHNRLFTDVQQKGPFAFWRHRHIFIPDGDGCLLRDEIDYRLPFGLTTLLAPLVEKDLRRMFQFRHQSTAAALA